MKIVETLEKSIRHVHVLKSKLCQQTLNEKNLGQLNTPNLIFKSHKTFGPD